MVRSSLAWTLLAWGLALAACDDYAIGTLQRPLNAYCTVNVVGVGTKDVETDYLPHVVTCENGGADTEALKAQAIAARSFMYYKIALSGSVKDGTSDQVYTCASQPSQKHYEAVAATAGQVLVYSNVVICSFFVAGAKPSTSDCVAAAGDPDPTSTEHYVTYNEGKSGSQVTQSSLGWVNPGNNYNRGCLSQNGSHCLSLKGRPYPEIVHFYYGADIQLVTATGSCVTPPLDSGPPPPDQGPPHDGASPKIDSTPGKLDLRKLDGPPRTDSGVARSDRNSSPWPEDAGPDQPGLGLRGSCGFGGAQASTAETLALGAIMALLLARWRRARRRWSERRPDLDALISCGCNFSTTRSPTVTKA
jgi:hypothetical protein